MAVWLDQIRRSLIESGELAAAGGRGLAARRDLQPRDLREGHPRLRRLRRGHRAGRRGRAWTPTRSTSSSRSRTCRLACDVMRPVHDDDAATASSPWRWSRRWRTTPTAPCSRRKELWAAVDRPNVMIKIPGTARGAARDRGGHRRRDQRERDAAVLGGGLRGRSPRPTSRAWSAATRRASRLDVHSVASFFVSRVDSEVDKRLEDARPRRPPGRRPRSPTPRPPTRASSASSAATASPQLRGGRRARAAAAVGLHRREEPVLSRDEVRGRPRGAGHGEHDADAHAAGRGREVRDHRRHRGPGPDRDARGARRRRHRHGRRDRQAAARRHRRVRRRRSTS